MGALGCRGREVVGFIGDVEVFVGGETGGCFWRRCSCCYYVGGLVVIVVGASVDRGV